MSDPAAKHHNLVSVSGGDRVEEWEKLVGLVSKRAIVQWSKTQHGGRKADLFRSFDESPKRASSYGLCE